jgi:hypothetical protein
LPPADLALVKRFVARVLDRPTIGRTGWLQTLPFVCDPLGLIAQVRAPIAACAAQQTNVHP